MIDFEDTHGLQNSFQVFLAGWSTLLPSSGDSQQKLESSQPPIRAAPRKTNNAHNNNNNNNNNNNKSSFRRCRPWPFQAVVQFF
jgi:hypothetical protein